MSIDDKGISEARERMRRKAQNEATVVALNNLLMLEQQRVRDLQSALSEATARAERAEAELMAAREQEPVAFTCSSWISECKSGRGGYIVKDRNNGFTLPLYASPIPAPAAQVPQEWRDVMAELAADLQAACEAEHPYREQYPSIMRKYQNDMAIVERARALLQEVKP